MGGSDPKKALLAPHTFRPLQRAHQHRATELRCGETKREALEEEMNQTLCLLWVALVVLESPGHWNTGWPQPPPVTGCSPSTSFHSCSSSSSCPSFAPSSFSCSSLSSSWGSCSTLPSSDILCGDCSGSLASFSGARGPGRVSGPRSSSRGVLRSGVLEMARWGLPEVSRWFLYCSQSQPNRSRKLFRSSSSRCCCTNHPGGRGEDA